MIDREKIAALHESAMKWVEMALAAGEASEARKWFETAFSKEQAAARLLADAYDEEPTRSVLYRSAATLALDCQNFPEAERLVEEGLAGRPPAEIADELKQLKQRIWAEVLAARRRDLRTA